MPVSDRVWKCVQDKKVGCECGQNKVMRCTDNEDENRLKYLVGWRGRPA